MREETFNWRAGYCCPAMYATGLLGNAFIIERGGEKGYITMLGSDYDPGGDWGEPGGAQGGGKKPLPSRLHINWISWVEGKAYYGEFDLPKEKMAELFRSGYPNNFNERLEYNHIAVGMAPEGAVFIWVCGIYRRVEVGRFQATVDTTVTVETFAPYSNKNDDGTYPTLAEFARKWVGYDQDNVEYVAKHGLRNHIWDTFRERFKLRPVVEYIGDEKGITDHFSMQFYNGERYDIALDSANQETYYDFARISEMIIYYSKDQKLFEKEIVFNETEILAAYKKIYGDDHNQKVDLVILVTPDDRIIRVSLRKKTEQGEEEVFLKDMKLINWEIDDRSRRHFRVFNSYKIKKI